MVGVDEPVEQQRQLVGGARRRRQDQPEAAAAAIARRMASPPRFRWRRREQGLRRPGHQADQQPVDRQVEGERHRHQHDQRREHQLDLQARVGVQHQVAEPGGRADPLADHGADRCHRGRDAQARAERRQRRRQAHPEQGAQARRAHGAGEVEPARLGPAQAVEQRGGDREIDDQDRHRDLAREAVAEPQHEQRREREHRDRLAEHQQRQEPGLERRQQRHRERAGAADQHAAERGRAGSR